MTDQRNLKPVHSFLNRVTEQQGWRQQLDLHSFFPHWDRLLPQSITAHSRPLKIVNRVLWLETDNSAWMQHLQFQKLRILETINHTLRLGQLEDIRFILADGTTAKIKTEQPTVQFIPPSPSELQSFEKQISSIQDEAIREALMSLWYQSKSCRRS